jgi:hypothetical protein
VTVLRQSVVRDQLSVTDNCELKTVNCEVTSNFKLET